MPNERSSTTPIVPGCSDRSPWTGTLPVRRRLTTLFVDIAGSTSLLVHNRPEAVLRVVQCFMSLVSEVAAAHAGRVKDYEGDGALLYFDETPDAVRAALAIRAALAAGRCNVGCGGGPGVAARMSLTTGDVVVGLVGTPARSAIALVGPSVNSGARLLKHVGIGGIIADAEVVGTLREEAPQLAEVFSLADPAFAVPGVDGLSVATYQVAESGGHHGWD